MHIDWWTLGLQAVNFAILVWLMQHFLYRHVLAAIDARRRAIDHDRRTAAEARAAAEQALLAQTQRLAEADDLRRSGIAAAEKEAAERREGLLAEARREVNDMRARARAQMAAERDDAALTLRLEAARLAQAMGERLLAGGPRPSAEPFLELLDAELDGVPAAATVAVACEPPLAPEAVERWRERLERRFGGGAVVVFTSDPGLIAGARIDVADRRFEASWRDTLARAVREMSDHAQPA